MFLESIWAHLHINKHKFIRRIPEVLQILLRVTFLKPPRISMSKPWFWNPNQTGWFDWDLVASLVWVKLLKGVELGKLCQIAVEPPVQSLSYGLTDASMTIKKVRVPEIGNTAKACNAPSYHNSIWICIIIICISTVPMSRSDWSDQEKPRSAPWPVQCLVCVRKHWSKPWTTAQGFYQWAYFILTTNDQSIWIEWKCISSYVFHIFLSSVPQSKNINTEDRRYRRTRNADNNFLTCTKLFRKNKIIPYANETLHPQQLPQCRLTTHLLHTWEQNVFPS